MQEIIIEKVLEPLGFKYYIPAWNLGTIIVT
jgi:hypothetical protein